MKTLIYSALTLGIVSATSIAQEASKIDVKVVTTSLSQGVPEDVDFKDKPMGYNPGATLVFYFQGENIVALDPHSFKAEGWDKFSHTRVSESGKTASLSVSNKNFKGTISEIKIDGTIEMTTGSKTETKKVVLKKGAEPSKFPAFTAQITLKDDTSKFGRSGVKVIGNFEAIKSVSIMKDGKEVTNRGWSSLNETKTFFLEDIKDGDEVTIVYWTDLKKSTVKLTN